MNALVLAELRLRHAQLTERAERLEQEWRTLPVSPKSTVLGKKVKALREQAKDYAALLDAVTLAEGRKS